MIAAEDAFHAANARYGTMSDLVAGELLPSPSTLFDAQPTADGSFYRLQSTECVAFPGLLGG